jgi:sigma-B regulation protein RsbU (phosphoserine phosphatase)
MSSISIRFALASVSVALFILALTSGINYLFLKEELLEDATQKAQLIEKNSRFQIEALISKTEETSTRVKNIFQNGNFDEKNIEKTLKKILTDEESFFGTTLAFKPTQMNIKLFSPYYYKKENKILYRDLASNDYNYLTKEWYRTPLKEEKPLWSEPYFDEGGGNILMATYSNPIFYKDELIAILTIDLSLQKIQEMVSSINILESGYAFILSKEHKILAHPDTSLVMQPYEQKSFAYNEMLKQKHNWIYYVHIINTDLTLVIVFPVNELFASLHYMSIISTVLAAIGAILLIITMFIISRRISEPLRELTSITDEISKGNFNKKITLPKNRDEIFRLSFAINTMQEAIVKYIQDLKTATIEQQKLDSELDIAKSIQMSMLPKNLPQNNTISLCAFLQPAKAVGGDFYDCFYVDKEHLCFAVADVSGKGVPAAMFMSVTMSYLRAYTGIGLSASELVTKLNNTIASNNDANMFVTLFFAILNLKNGELNYVNAGHNEPYLMSESKEYKRLKTVRNPVIGAFEDLKYKDEKVLLNEDSKLFLYTDGVTEAFSKNDELYGDKRLNDVLNKSTSQSVDATIQSVEKSIKTFTKNCEQSDDITMLLLEFKKI